MPHLHLEYSSNLSAIEPDKVLLRLNHALIGSGQFSHESDVKARAVRLDSFRVGTALAERGFVHVKLAILSGRPPAVKKQLSDSLLPILTEACAALQGIDIQMAVEILDIDRDSYANHRITG